MMSDAKKKNNGHVFLFSITRYYSLLAWQALSQDYT